ncbi:MAG: GMC family oxidoreductase [Parvularcula sp.]|jgi:choline dehydrogenase-like flavoprotein|nr:GMC family oxidoreductase [Parvularcula sp.]
MGTLKADIGIVGAGAAGTFFAQRLAEAGRRVVVLESGPRWITGDLISSQIWARRIKWGGAPVENEGPLRFGHNFNMGSGVGGAALHHYASWPRFYPTDFRTKSEFGYGLDWPLAYEDLQGHYDRIEAEFGVSGDAERETYRGPGNPYPHPPLYAFAGAETLARGFEKIGLPTYPGPMAILSESRGERQACMYDGWCDAGCPIGSLANPLVTSLPKAEAAGARFLTHCSVKSIATDRDGRARSILYTNKNNEIEQLEVETIILAAGAVHNVRILYGSQGTDGALGNKNDQLGRYFSSHLITNVHGVFNHKTEPYLGLSAGTLMAQYRPADGTGAVTWGLGPAVKPNDLIGIANTRPDLFGEALDEFLHRASHHIAIANGITESIAVKDSRILPPASADAQGRPIIRIKQEAHPLALQSWSKSKDQGTEALKAAGAQDIWTSPEPIVSHALGGTIMGEDPAFSVTNAYGQLHESPNVVVAGSGLFPSGSCVSPTLTLLALADRTAQRMISNARDFT